MPFFRMFLVAMSLAFAMCSSECVAQGPVGKDFGFGLVLIDPLGLTVKLWTAPGNAFVFDLGASNFGPTRLDGEYLWHYDAFHSSIVKMYAAPGVALAFGSRGGPFEHRWEFERPDDGLGVGLRAMFGINIIPLITPLEIFFEIGPLIGISPAGAALDAGLGIRFYP